MSNSALFWAAKSKGMKSPCSQAGVSTPAAQHESESKDFPSVKSMSFPTQSNTRIDKPRGATSGIKKTNWADSDDEEEFIASFNSSACIQELEKTLVAKDDRINDLLTSLQEDNVRIVELESALEKQNFHITGLEGAFDAYAAQIKELKNENHKKALQIEQLVGDVVDRDRRIAALETEVDEQCATIADLGLGDSSTQVSSHDASEAPKASFTVTIPQKVKVKANVVDSPQQAMQLELTNESGSGTATTALKIPAPTTKAAAGPAANLSIFPIFATASTVKQTIPPPPAPKLRMAVDLANFAKK